MIHVSNLRDFTHPERIERYKVRWGIGCTARELAPDWADDADPLVGCTRNSEPVKDWDALLADGDFIHYWARPGFEVALASAFLVNLGNAILFSIYGYLLTKLIAPTRKPVKPGDESSPTYAFNNLRKNQRGDGSPIPVMYGRNRVAPLIVNEYLRSSIDANGNPASEYLAMYALGEGPISAVGDKTTDGGPFTTEAGNALETLEINGQPAKNFQGVEAHIRLGNLDQTAIAEFADPVISQDVNKTLRASATLTAATATGDVPSGTTAIATAGQFTAGDANITKWDAQEAFTSGDDCDEFTALLQLPQGLIEYNQTTGQAIQNNVIYQARYRQVDDGGVPFGNYVVLPAEERRLTRAGFLRLESRHLTYAPATYGAPVVGKFAESHAAGLTNPGLRGTVTGYSPAGPAALQFTFLTWIKRRNVQAVSTTNELFEWYDSGANEGFKIRLVRGAVGASGSGVTVILGTGSAAVPFIPFGGNNSPTSLNLATDVTNWHQFCLTYEASYDGTNTRIRWYFDGALTGTTIITSTRAVLDATQTVRFGSDSHTAPTIGYDGHFDETTLWSRAITPYEVASNYNGGLPTAVDATSSGLIVGGRFDAGAGVSPNLGSAQFGPFASGNWILGSGTNAGTDPQISASAGIVRTPESGARLRGKFLVEVMRLNAEDTAQSAFSEIAFEAIQFRTFQQYEYPGVSLLAVKIPANDQLNGEAPLVTVRTDGRLVPVWDGVNPVYPTMVSTYSRNPAWVCADVLLNRDFGLGGVYRPTDLDVAQFKVFADYCDVLQYDNMDRQAIMTAAYLDSAAEAVTFSAVNLGQDVVRYRVAGLPANFPQTTTAATGRFIKPILTGLSPAAPSWLTAQAALVAQEVIFVEYRTADSSFYIYTKTTQSLAAGQTVYTVSSGSDETNGLEMHDVRCRYDGVFDRADFPAWDGVTQILQTARAAPIRIGSRLTIFVDDVSNPVALIGMGSIIEGSWRQGFMGVADRPNAESGEFNDELLNFERVPVEDEHPDITDPGSQSSFRWRRVALEGITRRGQAKRFLRRDLNTFKLVRRWCEFELGLDSLPLLPGDLLALSHDLPQYGFSGRIITANTASAIKLDRAITLDSGHTYQVQIEDASAGTRETKTVTQAAGTYAAGTAITVASFSFIPDENDEYALGDVTIGETKLFRLVESTFDPIKFRKKLKCVEYDEQIYSDDFGTLPITSPSALPVPTAPVVPPGVENLSVTEVSTRGPDGSVRTSLRVAFDHVAETFSSVASSDVYLSIGDHSLGISGAEHKARLDANATSVTIEHAYERNQLYTVWVVPRTRAGSTSHRIAISWAETTPTGLTPVPDAPENLRGVVAGDMATYEWDDPGDMDHAAVVEARIGGGWFLGMPLFISPAQSRHSNPTPNWVSAPTNAHGVSTPYIIARTKMRNGQYSAAALLLQPLAAAATDGNAFSASEEDSNWS